ncbi:MAG: Dyp-type peroxidase, partial [Micrococcales bacterium]|nr:Dyp-type peroxidase [Micrococcales bacterium]
MTPARPSRRTVLGGSAALAGGLAGGILTGCTRGPDDASSGSGLATDVAGPGVAGPIGRQNAYGPEQVPFYGRHQGGILTPQQAHGSFIGLDLPPGATRTQVLHLLRMLSDDAARLCSGRQPLGALEAVPAQTPARLSVTFGFGPGLCAAAKRPDRCPAAVRSLPAFTTDRLQERWGQTHLLLQVCSDDPTSLAYARRRLIRDAATIASVRWVQTGFVTARGSDAVGASPRNLLGLRDGSANERDLEQRAQVAWSSGPGPWRGGSQVVLRRVRLDLDRWDDIDTMTKEAAFGRRLDGSPLSSPAGTSEFTPVDRQARDADGFDIVLPSAHAARAQARVGAERMLRRGYSYDDGRDERGQDDAGLLFVAYQGDLATAFVPVQRRLAASDALNT